MNLVAWDDVLARWAASRSDVRAVVMIGSRLRDAGPAARDAHADWDFQLIVRDPVRFADKGWWDELVGVPAPAAYVVRPAFGGVQKVTAVGTGVGELDLVVLPGRSLAALRTVRRLGLLRLFPRGHVAHRALADLALVIRPGYRFVAGERMWAPFYEKVVREVGDPRLDDAAAISLAEGVVCDLVWLRRKLARGELLAVQRALHGSLAETNFRLLHELRSRRGLPSLPEARRAERLLDADALASVTIDARPGTDALLAAAEHAAETTRQLMRGLVGDAWRWPDGF